MPFSYQPIDPSRRWGQSINYGPSPEEAQRQKFLNAQSTQQAASSQNRMQQPWDLINQLGQGMSSPINFGLGGSAGGAPSAPFGPAARQTPDLRAITGITEPQFPMPSYQGPGGIAGMGAPMGAAFRASGEAQAGPNQLALQSAYYPGAGDLRQAFQQSQAVGGLGWADLGSQQARFLQDLLTRQQGGLLGLLGGFA